MIKNNKYFFMMIMPIFVLINYSCSLFFDSDNGQKPTINVKDEYYLNTDTLRVEVVNTTGSGIQVVHLNFYFDFFLGGRWVEEFVVYKPYRTFIEPWVNLGTSDKIVEFVSINEYDFRQGKYRLRMGYRKTKTEHWLFASSNGFELLFREQ